MIDKNNEKIPIEDEDTDNDPINPIFQILHAIDKATQSDEGTDYKPLYYDLYRGITLIIENTDTYEQTIAALKVLQCKAEDFYISQG